MIIATLTLMVAVSVAVATILVVTVGVVSYVSEGGPFDWGMLVGRVALLFAWFGFAVAFVGCILIAMVSFGLTVAVHPLVREITSVKSRRLVYAVVFSAPIVLASCLFIVPFGAPSSALVGLLLALPSTVACFGLAWLAALVAYPAPRTVAVVSDVAPAGV